MRIMSTATSKIVHLVFVFMLLLLPANSVNSIIRNKKRANREHEEERRGATEKPMYPPNYIHDEAVVYTARVLDDCRKKRLIALAAGAKRDVWLLHDFEAVTSYKYIYESMRENEVQPNPQSKLSWAELMKLQAKERFYHNTTKFRLEESKAFHSRAKKNMMHVPNLYITSQTKGVYPNFIDVSDCTSTHQSCTKNAFLHFTTNSYEYDEIYGPRGTQFANKSSRMKYIRSRLANYKHIWTIEDDVFYTGDWEHFFNETLSPENNININDGLQKPEHFETDARHVFLQSNVPDEVQKRYGIHVEKEPPLPEPSRPVMNNNYRHSNSKSSNKKDDENYVDSLGRSDLMIRMAKNQEPYGSWHWYQLGCRIAGKKCTASEMPVSSLWFTARFSTRFLHSFADALVNGVHGHDDTYGFHEALISPFVFSEENRHKFTVSRLPQVGLAAPGHWSPYFGTENNTILSLSYLSKYKKIENNRIYHPVKCEADSNTGHKQAKYAEMSMNDL